MKYTVEIVQKSNTITLKGITAKELATLSDVVFGQCSVTSEIERFGVYIVPVDYMGEDFSRFKRVDFICPQRAKEWADLMTEADRIRYGGIDELEYIVKPI